MILYLSLFLACWLLERLAHKAAYKHSLVNLAYFAINAPLYALPIFSQGSEENWSWLGLGMGFLLLELVAWSTHILQHHIPILWYFHKVHHADRELDVTSGFVNHPLDEGLLLATRLALVVLLGMPLWLVLFHEGVWTCSTLLVHSRFRLPEWWARSLGYLLVTPNSHQVHHDSRVTYTNSNYGQVLSIYDHLFGTHKECYVPVLGLEWQPKGFLSLWTGR